VAVECDLAAPAVRDGVVVGGVLLGEIDVFEIAGEGCVSCSWM